MKSENQLNFETKQVVRPVKSGKNQADDREKMLLMMAWMDLESRRINHCGQFAMK